MTMITEDRLNKLWKRLIWHWLFVCLIFFGIVIYLLFNNENGDGLTPLSALGIIIIIFLSIIFVFFITKLIKNIIYDIFGDKTK